MQTAITNAAQRMAGPKAFVETADSSAGAQLLKFPSDFIWGTATASYQIEGAWDEGGRGLSIWDTFSQQHLNDNGNAACDHYHLYEQDVALMASLGLKNYRLSIAWPRIQPTGRGPANPEGVAFYNRLINCLLAHGIQPLVTLYHWDLPQALETEFGGWLGRDVVPLFAEYARLCFENFGDRVKFWLTFNEPWCTAVLGYGTGEHAPGIKDEDGTQVYLSGHHLLLSHAAAVDLYRRRFQPLQRGTIGITLNANWSEPVADADATAAANHADAARRMLLWSLGWFADPIWIGDYPEDMRNRCGDRLPKFTEEEKALLKGSSDYLGLNHYATDFAKDNVQGDFVSHWGTPSSGGYFGDQGGSGLSHPSWAKTDMGWNVVPWGFTKLLLWCHERYHPAGGIVVTENGCAVPEPTKEDSLNDAFRVDFLRSYVAGMHEAMERGADVRGYFAWSFLDNFEWALGYSKRFGIVRVDYDTQERTPKASAKWFAETIKANAVLLPPNQRFLDAAREHTL